jgi:hypoxanthine-DNA glycosylase
VIEKHPFGDFVPMNSKYLFLGSFPAKPADRYEWFFSNGRNQLWSIMEGVYKIELKTKHQKQELFGKLKMAIADLILECERENNSNLDNNLKIISLNTKGIGKIFRKNKIEKVFFTSRFVENLFKRQFKNAVNLDPKAALVYLPSPSPRYAAMRESEKIIRYRKLLPKIS